MYKALSDLAKHLRKWAIKKLAIHCVVSDRLSTMPGPRNPTRRRGKMRHRVHWWWIGFRRRLLPDEVSECVKNIGRRGKWLRMGTADRYAYFDGRPTETERIWPHHCENPKLHKQIHKRSRYLLSRQGFNMTPKRRDRSMASHRRRDRLMKQIADNMTRESEYVRIPIDPIASASSEPLSGSA